MSATENRQEVISEIRKNLQKQNDADCHRLIHAAVLAVAGPGMMSTEARSKASMQLRGLAMESPRHAAAYDALAEHLESYDK